MACRTYNNNDSCGLSFIGTILMVSALSLVFFCWFLLPKASIALYIVFFVLFAMVMWALLATAFTEPGRVPFYWGISNQNNESQQRKYCLICHNFKPQRCHHCSACKKCVLNMDHHCPWVNNCVGFHNRKMFILFLFYLELGLIFFGVVCVITMVGQFQQVAKTGQTDINFAMRLLCTFVVLPLVFVIGPFFHFHFKMVLENTTTLENMIANKSHKIGLHQVEDSGANKYDMGKLQNFQQVFGENGFLWAIPVYGEGPKGTGTVWPTADEMDNLQTARGLIRNPKY